MPKILKKMSLTEFQSLFPKESRQVIHIDVNSEYIEALVDITLVGYKQWNVKKGKSEIKYIAQED